MVEHERSEGPKNAPHYPSYVGEDPGRRYLFEVALDACAVLLSGLSIDTETGSRYMSRVAFASELLSEKCLDAGRIVPVERVMRAVAREAVAREHIKEYASFITLADQERERDESGNAVSIGGQLANPDIIKEESDKIVAGLEKIEQASNP